jgi:hypothetical protein
MAMGIFVAAARDMAGDIVDKSLDHGIFAVQADRGRQGLAGKACSHNWLSSPK